MISLHASHKIKHHHEYLNMIGVAADHMLTGQDSHDQPFVLSVKCMLQHAVSHPLVPE